jgi:hypothetical protein
VLDLWNVMSYDFAGSWNTTANHQVSCLSGRGHSLLIQMQANLRGPAPSCEATISLFQSMGVSPNKLVLGIPLYGRSFTKCAGAGSGYEGLGKGTLEKGVYDYRALPLPGAVEVSDPIGAAWCRTPDGEWVTYDSVETAADKAGYVNWAGLAGTFYWDMSGDAVGARSIVQTVRRGVSAQAVSSSQCRGLRRSLFAARPARDEPQPPLLPAEPLCECARGASVMVLSAVLLAPSSFSTLPLTLANCTHLLARCVLVCADPECVGAEAGSGSRPAARDFCGPSHGARMRRRRSGGRRAERRARAGRQRRPRAVRKMGQRRERLESSSSTFSSFSQILIHICSTFPTALGSQACT